VLRLMRYERISVQNRRFRSNGDRLTNLDRSFFRFVTIHAFDRRTDVQTAFSSLDRVCIPCSAVKTITDKLALGLRLGKIWVRVRSD